MLTDFDQLAEGLPELRSGRKRWRFVLLLVKADEEAKVAEFGFVSYGDTHGQVCGDCMCDEERPFTDMGRDARWRETEDMTFEAWRGRFWEPLHIVIRSHYCCSRFFLYMELMHLADCKGVSSLAFGSVLEYLLRRPSLGDNRGDRLVAVNAFMAQWYRDRPGSHRLPPLRPGNVRAQDGWADLHGPNIKAANTRAAAPLFRDLVRRYCDGSEEGDASMIVICEGLADYYGELYSSDVFCTDDKVVAITATVGEHWMRMRALPRRRSILAWKVTPKVHNFQHTGLCCQVLNPRHAQVYAEESLVGTMVKVWRMSVSGRYQAHAQRIVLVKRVLSVLLRYEGL